MFKMLCDSCFDAPQECGVSTQPEDKTRDILQVVYDVIIEQKHWYAYRIMSELHRKKMDPSRGIYEVKQKSIFFLWENQIIDIRNS